MQQILWKTAAVDMQSVETMAAKAKVPVYVARWLCARSVPSDEAQEWLNPANANYSSPLDFTEMLTARDIILDAVERGETIGLVGDYDVDGVTASVIMAGALDLLKAQWICDIPHRVEDGYGLSEVIVQRLKQQGVSLIVTVDNGIRAHGAIRLAKDLGMRVVVTDHHEPSGAEDDKLAADAVVHWARALEGVKLQHLSGAGVAWKLSLVLLRQGVDAGELEPQLVEKTVRYSTALAALGALADIMPMTLENRKLVEDGLGMLKTCERLGWRALCRVAGLDAEAMNSRSLLWRITPRLNAAGRMDSADVAFELLWTEDASKAEALADRIESLNQERRQATEEVLREALAQCDGLLAEHPGGLVVAGPWPRGVVGIVAAKLVDQFERPVLVLSDEGTDILVGSGRSTDGISLVDALQGCSSLLHHFGGHEAAVGCGVNRDNLPLLRQRFSDMCVTLVEQQGDLQTFSNGRSGLAAEVSGESQAAAVSVADDFLALSQVNLDLLQWVERFAPFGPDNPPLTFYLGPLEVRAVTPMGNGKHLRITVSEGGQTANLVWFGAPKEAAGWMPGSRISAIVEVQGNHWRGQLQVQLRILEAKLMPEAVSRQEFGKVYRLLKARRKLKCQDAYSLLPAVGEEDVQMMLDAFVELGFAQCRESAYHVVEPAESRDLRESSRYHQYLYRTARGLGKENINNH